MDQLVTALGAVVGVPAVLIGYIVLTEKLLERLPGRVQNFARPYVWALPALAFAGVFMVFPLINTIILSFENNASTKFVGLANYQYFFTFPDTLIALRNSVLWLVFFTFFTVIGGLLIAIMVDRVKYEAIAKTAIFLPLPISAVAASIIWRFMFDYQPSGTAQTGTMNAIIGTFGFQPVAWLVNSTTNNAALIFVGIWSQIGFAMVIISASLKAISSEVLEAARIDGANEFRIVQLIITPLLWPTITVVGTTMIIYALKVFDLVYVLTSGAYETDVIASQMFRQLTSGHYGRAGAVGVVLFLATVPLLVINVRRFQQQEEQR